MTSKAATSRVEYLLGLGTPQLLDMRVEAEEIRLHVNGPGIQFGRVRILTSLRVEDGATFGAWTKLGKSLRCTSYCGASGKTTLPITVDVSSVDSCLSFSTGPMAHYQSTVVLRPKKARKTLRETIDDAFENDKAKYHVMLVPETLAHGHDHDSE